MAFGFGLILSCFGLFIALLTGAVVVRAAVALANRMIGPVKTDDFGQWDDWDSDEEPAYVRNRRRGGEQAVPEPGYGTGLLVAFIAFLAHLFIGIALGFLTEEIVEDLTNGKDGLATLAVIILSVPLVFAIVTMVLRVLLSITFSRAALVTFLCYFIVGTVAALIVGVIYGAWLVTGP